VATRLCPVCGSTIPEQSARCERCGSRIPAPRAGRILGRYSALRLQIDPTDPPPERDVRWPILVLGVCCLVVSGFLLLVYEILNVVVSPSASPCGGGPDPSPCLSTVTEYVFLTPALVLLAIGAVAVVAVLLDL
jgi:hypothetical protein